MLPYAKDTNMLVFCVLGNAKVLSFALGDAKVPNENGFASQWNISFIQPIQSFLPWSDDDLLAKVLMQDL